jgi:hypothetical protein
MFEKASPIAASE